MKGDVMKEAKAETLPVSELAHKLTLSVAEARALSGLGLGEIQRALKSGALKRVKIAKGVAIRRSDLESWVAGLDAQ